MSEISDEQIEAALSELVDRGWAEMSINDDGEFVWRMTEAGRKEIEGD